MKRWQMILAAQTLALLGACGGSGSPWTGDDDDGGSPGAPSAPVGIAANAGDTMVSLGWSAPTTGTGPFTYTVTLSPSSGGASITQAGTTALVRSLSNNTAYTFSVTARNSAGQGPAATVQATPHAEPTNGNAYTTLTITGNTANEPSGITDPALLRVSASEVWMAYGGANYRTVSGNLVQDVSVGLARSTNGGQNFAFSRTLGNAAATVVTDTTGLVCGNATCTGRWVYERPWLLDDSGDPNTNRRYKLFAHKYFLYPPGLPSTQYLLGTIVMWTAPALDGTWSAEQSLLGWNNTPPELTPHRNINALHVDVQLCEFISEGSAAVRNSAIEFVFACTYDIGGALEQKIVMLRSSDHAGSFQYVNTLLTANDAAAFNAAYFSAPSLLPGGGNAPVLLATPVFNDLYAGCVALPFSDAQAGTLYRSNSTPLALLELPTRNAHFGGACAWDRGISATGILMMDRDLTQTRIFNILATGQSL